MTARDQSVMALGRYVCLSLTEWALASWLKTLIIDHPFRPIYLAGVEAWSESFFFRNGFTSSDIDHSRPELMLVLSLKRWNLNEKFSGGHDVQKKIVSIVI